VSGAAGSNECPAGSVRIETEAACRTAVAAAGKTLRLVWTNSSSPRGCYHSTRSNNAYFNTDAVGAGSSGYQLLCAADTTGALPSMHRCACVCMPARARDRAWWVRALWRRHVGTSAHCADCAARQRRCGGVVWARFAHRSVVGQTLVWCRPIGYSRGPVGYSRSASPRQVGAGRWGVDASGNMLQRTAPRSGNVYIGTHGVLTGY
jgi:hypothetical protein